MNTIFKFKVFVAIILGFVVNPVVAGPIDPGEFSAKCDKLLSLQFKAGGPGAAALVARNGQVVYKNAFGMANLELQVPMRVDNVFRIGSVTKQFTGVAILQLVEQGKIGLQDEITKFIPDYPTQGNKITIENLVTHTSGIQDHVSVKDSSKKGEIDYTPLEMIDFFKDRPLRFLPGSKWEYSNSNYTLLGHIIELVTEKPFGTYLQEYLFAPSGMTNSSYSSNIKLTMNRASGYSMGEQGIENARYFSMTHPYAAGAIQSTVEDLFKWYQALYAYKLISKASLDKALSPFTLSNGDKTNYGYGFRFGFIQDSPSIWHGGMINGFISMAMYLPKEDVFVAVFTNCDCNSPEDVTAKLAALAIGEPYDYTAVAQPDSILSEFEGVYENERGRMQIISVDDHQLYAQSGMGPKSKLDAVTTDKFAFERDSLTRIDFVRGARGSVAGLKIRSRKSIEMWTRSNKPVPSPDGIEVSEKLLESYVGQYSVTPEFGFSVTKVGRRLQVTGTGQEPLDIFAETETKFFLKVNDAQLEFVSDESGRIIKAILTQGGRETNARKTR